MRILALTRACACMYHISGRLKLSHKGFKGPALCIGPSSKQAAAEAERGGVGLSHNLSYQPQSVWLQNFAPVEVSEDSLEVAPSRAHCSNPNGR